VGDGVIGFIRLKTGTAGKLFEHADDTAVSIKCCEFLGWVSNCQRLKDCTPCG
jgi:hypothetical protein